MGRLATRPRALRAPAPTAAAAAGCGSSSTMTSSTSSMSSGGRIIGAAAASAAASPCAGAAPASAPTSSQPIAPQSSPPPAPAPPPPPPPNGGAAPTTPCPTPPLSRYHSTALFTSQPCCRDGKAADGQQVDRWTASAGKKQRLLASQLSTPRINRKKGPPQVPSSFSSDSRKDSLTLPVASQA